MLLRDINKNTNSVKPEQKSYLTKWKQFDARMKNLKMKTLDWSLDLVLMSLLSKTQKCKKLRESFRIDTNRWNKIHLEVFLLWQTVSECFAQERSRAFALSFASLFEASFWWFHRSLLDWRDRPFDKFVRNSWIHQRCGM